MAHNTSSIGQNEISRECGTILVVVEVVRNDQGVPDKSEGIVKGSFFSAGRSAPQNLPTAPAAGKQEQ